MYCTVQACVCGSVLSVLLCLLNINIVLYCTGNVCVDLCYLYCYVYLTLILYCTVQACVCGSVLSVLLCLLNINIVLYCTGMCVWICAICTAMFTKQAWLDGPSSPLHWQVQNFFSINKNNLEISNTMRPIIPCNRKTT